MSCGRQPALDLDPLFDVVQPGRRLELVEDRLAIARVDGLPVVVGPQVGRVDQDVEGLAAGRGDLGLGGGRGADVAGRVGRRLALAVDEVELLVRVAREDEVVMQEMLVAAVEAQVEDDARAGRLVAGGVSRTGAAAGVPASSSRCVRTASAVGDHGRQRRDAAVVELDSRRRLLRARSGSSGRRLPVRSSTPSSPARRARASATARVPPRGYQTPSPVCMWAMPQRTAGERSGDEPTYWVK